MTEELYITQEEKPEEAAWGIIGRGLSAYNKQQAGDNNFQRLCYVLKAADETIVGGILGEVDWGWFYIDLLWVKEEFRGRGYGHRLLTRAEGDARSRGAENAYLDTFSFQSVDFYKQHGYQVFGELPGFPAGHDRFFMRKSL